MVAIGGPLRPRLLQAGYSDAFSTALIINASDIALLIPPSIGMIVYGVVSGTSIGELFIAGIGPGPFAAMLLADMGAEVVRVERAGAVRGPLPDGPHFDVLLRGRRNVAIDLKHPDGVEALLTLVESADALIEGFRPGVMERLGNRGVHTVAELVEQQGAFSQTIGEAIEEAGAIGEGGL